MDIREYPASYVKNYDGDTITFDVDVGFSITHRIQVRLADIDTPELRGGTDETKALAVKARDHVAKRLLEANAIIIQTEKDEKGKYGRYIARVFFRHEEYAPDGWSDIRSDIEEIPWVNLGDELIAEGLGIYKEY